MREQQICGEVLAQFFENDAEEQSSVTYDDDDEGLTLELQKVTHEKDQYETIEFNSSEMLEKLKNFKKDQVAKEQLDLAKLPKEQNDFAETEQKQKEQEEQIKQQQQQEEGVQGYPEESKEAEEAKEPNKLHKNITVRNTTLQSSVIVLSPIRSKKTGQLVISPVRRSTRKTPVQILLKSSKFYQQQKDIKKVNNPGLFGLNKEDGFEIPKNIKKNPKKIKNKKN